MRRVTWHRIARAAQCVGILATAGLAGCGGVTPAPATGTLPLARQARVIASGTGGSQVDPAHDHNQYRYLALIGPLHVAGARFISAQVLSMIDRGWGQERSVGFRGASTVAQPVPVTAAGAEVFLNSPDGKEYAALSLMAGRKAANVQTSHTPLSSNAAIAAALAARRPVLWVVLGNGKHS